jgi:VIT1/CCC1 family predicted Fe2+/Mn2+ transporter
MMKEELEMIEQKKSPLKMGLITYISFILIGLIPLSIYVWDYFYPITSSLFVWSSVLTACGFIIVGILKSYVNQTNKLKGVFETLILGMAAALVSYYVGHFLEILITER